MSDGRRAWSDFPGHVVVRVANREYGFDLSNADKLEHDLRHAIDEARQMPFERWWNSLHVASYPGHRLLISSVGSLPITRDEGEKLFNQIREAR